MSAYESRDEMLFVALGGAGEIGMNMYLYGFGPASDRHWMMVDCGISFANGTLPGIDVIMADPYFVEECIENLDGLVLTHAHEDHLGAVPYLWQRLKRPPVYATPFTCSILRRKLPEAGLKGKLKISEVPLGGRFMVGPFDIEMVSLTHSIPEPNALAIRTRAGLVLHTGDWCFDSNPVIGADADEEALKQLGNDGVLAMLCDSTNVFTHASKFSESDLEESLTKLIGSCKNRVAVACFATNVARLKTISAAAKACGRDVVLAGRSLRRIDDVARENGYLKGVAAFLDEDDAGYLPKDKILIVCTGSQGESRSALAKISCGKHPRISLEEGDLVIFSSKIIPGNEKNIAYMQNALVRRKIRVITEHDNLVHVSGHPSREEMIRMYDHVRPRISVPIHGEIRHLMEHANLADKCGVEKSIVAENGAVVRLFPGDGEIVGHVATSRLAFDSNRLISVGGPMVRSRNRALYNGTAMVSVVIDTKGRTIGEPRISTIGLFDENENDECVVEAVSRAIGNLPNKSRGNDEKVVETVRLAVRRTLRKRFGKKPETIVHLMRV